MGTEALFPKGQPKNSPLVAFRIAKGLPLGMALDTGSQMFYLKADPTSLQNRDAPMAPERKRPLYFWTFSSSRNHVTIPTKSAAEEYKLN